MLRVLLDGGSNRSFDREDAEMLEEDFNLLKVGIIMESVSEVTAEACFN